MQWVSPLHHLLLKIALTNHLKRTMTENTNPNSTTLPIATSGSATIHSTNQIFISWMLFEFSEARTPDRFKTMQNCFRRFRKLSERFLRGLHMRFCTIFGVLSFGVGSDAKRWKKFYTVACQLKRPSHRLNDP